MNILIPVFILGGLGLAFGIGLALAAKKFCVTVDPRIDEIFTKLPGANCGACGMPGCLGFAEALIQGACTLERCTVTEESSRENIARILGLELKPKIKTAAVLHCFGGNKRAKDKFVYDGSKDCLTANLTFGGPKGCSYGCIGYGSCAKICPFGAISMNEENLPVVDETKCTACGKCVAGCPKKLFNLAAAAKIYAVRCKALDLGKKVMEVCSIGCIACRKCEKACPKGAIKVVDNLASIDYAICDNSGECFKVCPTKAIAKKENKLWEAKK